MNGMIGRKLGMTRFFDDEGQALPVTVIEAGPCPVVQVKVVEGQPATVQLGFGTRKARRTAKALAGHAAKANLESAPRVLREFPQPEGFAGGPKTHGSTRHRGPGSMGPGTDPSRVIKGKKLPGQTGNVRFTELGLSIVRVDEERNLVYVRGAVPGPRQGIVILRKQGSRGRYA